MFRFALLRAGAARASVPSTAARVSSGAVRTAVTLAKRPAAGVHVKAALSRYPAPVACTVPSYRSMFIQTQDTPNPLSLQFFPNGEVVMEEGTYDFPNYRAALVSPLARKLFEIDGVAGVFFASDYISVTKVDDDEYDHSWEVIKPQVFAVVMDFYASGKKIIDPDAAPTDTAPAEEDDEVVGLIKELIDTRIRPSVQEDGGDIQYKGFIDGVVYIKMQGACSGCPSSEITLKSGIENMLMHYVPEVEEVREATDEMDEVSNEQLQNLEAKLNKE